MKPQQLKNKPRNVAEYIEWQINLCGKSQLEIAEICGFDKPNVITMIKQGKTKLPLAKIAKMAKALEVDPAHLLRLCMEEYMPEAWLVVSDIIDRPTVSETEFEFVREIRKSSVVDPVLNTDDERARFQEFLNTLKSINQAK